MMLTDGLKYKHRLRIAECLREDILELIEVYAYILRSEEHTSELQSPS